ncbi:uncharacterized protein PSFLO_07445 [Pseudozyma flocculosa]|uniref:Uncharacterized protein n=1 Tax=Pseudozyma flocculosa TaxID=84751 RepID=A0A5C3FC32_9BASI|nr:uncharacterized protein PSFLO_07445 [Pseudozyma flocculosa]
MEQRQTRPGQAKQDLSSICALAETLWQADSARRPASRPAPAPSSCPPVCPPAIAAWTGINDRGSGQGEARRGEAGALHLCKIHVLAAASRELLSWFGSARRGAARRTVRARLESRGGHRGYVAVHKRRAGSIVDSASHRIASPRLASSDPHSQTTDRRASKQAGARGNPPASEGAIEAFACFAVGSPTPRSATRSPASTGGSPLTGPPTWYDMLPSQGSAKATNACCLLKRFLFSLCLWWRCTNSQLAPSSQAAPTARRAGTSNLPGLHHEGSLAAGSAHAWRGTRCWGLSLTISGLSRRMAERTQLWAAALRCTVLPSTCPLGSDGVAPDNAACHRRPGPDPASPPQKRSEQQGGPWPTGPHRLAVAGAATQPVFGATSTSTTTIKRSGAERTQDQGQSDIETVLQEQDPTMHAEKRWMTGTALHSSLSLDDVEVRRSTLDELADPWKPLPLFAVCTYLHTYVGTVASPASMPFSSLRSATHPGNAAKTRRGQAGGTQRHARSSSCTHTHIHRFDEVGFARR